MFRFKEKDYLVKIIGDDDLKEVLQYQNLRYRLKVQKFKWITAPDPRKPIAYDKYDAHSIHFGAFNPGGKLRAYSRLILPTKNSNLQIFDEFDSLIDPDFTPNWSPDSSAEVSSLLVDDDFKHPIGYRFGAAQWLYKIMLRWSIINKRRYWYVVSEKRFIRALRFQGFPFKIIGEGKDYQGAVTYPAVLDLDECCSYLMRTNRDALNWYVEDLDLRRKGYPPKILL